MRLRTITVIFVLVCALAVPASASAYYSSGSGSDDSSIAARTPTELSQRIPTPAPTVSSETDGFHWGDAALGAGAAIALFTLGGVALVSARRRSAMSPFASTG